MMNSTQFDRVELMMKQFDFKLDRVEKMMREILRDYEDDEAEVLPPPKIDQFSLPMDDDPIYTRGERVPYNKLEGSQMNAFRNFLSHIRMNESQFSGKEIDYASFADKNFSDIRLSDNMKRILENAYMRTYREPWQFRFIKGYLHKYDGGKAWSWADGTRD